MLPRRLWNVMDNKSVRLEALLNNNKNPEFCAPLTSFDWNHVDTSVVVASNFHASHLSCTVWDINTNKREEDIKRV